MIGQFVSEIHPPSIGCSTSCRPLGQECLSSFIIVLQFVTKLAARELIYKHPEMLLLDETKNEAIQTISPIETIIDRIVKKKMWISAINRENCQPFRRECARGRHLADDRKIR